MSSVQSRGALLVLVTLTRGFGQSALSVVSLAMVGQVVPPAADLGDGRLRAGDEHRLHDGVSRWSAPSCGAAAGAWRGRRSAWRSLLVLAPMAWLFDRVAARSDRRSRSTAADAAPTVAREPRPPRSATALRSPAFWVFGAGQLALRARRVGHRAVQRVDPGRARLHARHLLHTRWR